MIDDERQYGFFRIASAMTKQYELGKMKKVIEQMEPGQLEKMIEEAIERGDSRVMITDVCYIGFNGYEPQSSTPTASEKDG